MVGISRKQRDKELRRDDILKAAEYVFATKGYHEATVADIAKQSQYAVGTIYLYFKDKEGLYLNLVEKKAQDMINTIKQRVGMFKSPKEKIKILIQEHLEYFRRNENFFKIYFSTSEGFNWTIKSKVSKNTVAKFMDFVDYVDVLIKKAQKNNVIKKGLNHKQVAFVLCSVLKTSIFLWLKRDFLQKKVENSKSCVTPCIGDIENVILEIFFNGVSV